MVVPECERIGFLAMPNCPHCDHELTPHQIGKLKGAARKVPDKLSMQDIKLIRQSKDMLKDLAKEYGRAISTISRIKNGQTYSGKQNLNCPYCGRKLTPQQISKLFASLGGSTYSPAKAKLRAAMGRKKMKLSNEDITDIQQSNASTSELARKYQVSKTTIRKAKNYWKLTPILPEET
jgi:hypothetical protein